MRERVALAIAAGFGEDASRSKGERASRRRSLRAPQHVWIERDGGVECRWCRVRSGWPGATQGCGNAHAKNMEAVKARKNDETPAASTARASGTANTE